MPAGLFDRTGNAGPTVWVQGRVFGAWTQGPDGSVVVETPTGIDADTQAAIDIEAARVAAWLGDVRVKWRYPTPRTRQLDGWDRLVPM